MVLSDNSISVMLTSIFYYNKEEIEKLVALFSSISLDDKRLRTIFEALGSLLDDGSLEKLPNTSTERKTKIITLLNRELDIVENQEVRERSKKLVELTSYQDSNIELAENLLQRYCWEDFKNKIHEVDIKDIPFAEKLNVKPVVPDFLEDEEVKSIGEIDISNDNESNNSEEFPTGITRLDNLVKMKRSQFCVIAARTSVGKSLFMVNQAINLVLNENKHILFVSLEESQEEIKKRVVTYLGKTNDLINNGFHVYTPKVSSPDTIFRKSKELIERFGVSVVFIDYLQLLKYGSMNDFDSLRKLTRELKMFAVSTDTLLVTASQLKRESEILGGGLSSLFGSSTIEADANVVLILEPMRKGNVRVKNKSQVYINIAKNRGGAQAKISDIEIDYSNGQMDDLGINPF